MYEYAWVTMLGKCFVCLDWFLVLSCKCKLRFNFLIDSSSLFNSYSSTFNKNISSHLPFLFCLVNCLSFSSLCFYFLLFLSRSFLCDRWMFPNRNVPICASELLTMRICVYVNNTLMHICLCVVKKNKKTIYDKWKLLLVLVLLKVFHAKQFKTRIMLKLSWLKFKYAHTALWIRRWTWCCISTEGLCVLMAPGWPIAMLLLFNIEILKVIYAIYISVL